MNLIVDANNMAHRARHSYQLSYRGKDTSVTYGVIRMMMSLLKEVRPDSVIMCFDGGSPKYRRMLYPKYKAQRHHDEDLTYVEFVRQMNELEQILPCFGLAVVRQLGIEADDLMYHASRLLDGPSVIVTNDDDLLQAVNGSTSVMKPGKDKAVTYTTDNFERLTGIPIDSYLYAKVLMGDSSDNLSGCAGIGIKTAVRMFQGIEQDGNELKCNVGVMNDNLRTRFDSFMANEFAARYVVSRLEYDMSGAKWALTRLLRWSRFTNKDVYHYCFENMFASLTENGSLGALFGKLKQPSFNLSGQRIPRIWSADRHPVEIVH